MKLHYAAGFVCASLVAVGQCWTAAKADVYTYDVSFAIGADTVAGTIVTNCDVCSLSPSDIMSYSFTINGGANISSTDNSMVTGSIASPLTATPTAIDFIPTNTDSSLNFTDNDTRNGLDFTTFSGQDSQIMYISSPAAFFTLNIPTTNTSFTIAQIATTPLPAALPLFATGLGALGLLGWRKKRKAGGMAA
jgi:hypothetical protein